MKRILAVLVVVMALMALMLSGCGTQYMQVAEKGIERIPEDIGRFSAHLGVRKEEEKTKQKVAEANKAEADAEKAKAANVSINIDTTEKYLAYALAESNKVLGKAVEALARRDGGNEYELATTPTPKGVIAETLDSAGNAIEKVANTPAAVGGVIGATVANVARHAINGAGDKVQTGDNSPATINKDKTSTQASNTAESGTATGTTSGTKPASEVVQVEPFLVDVPAAAPVE